MIFKVMGLLGLLLAADAISGTNELLEKYRRLVATIRLQEKQVRDWQREERVKVDAVERFSQTTKEKVLNYIDCEATRRFDTLRKQIALVGRQFNAGKILEVPAGEADKLPDLSSVYEPMPLLKPVSSDSLRQVGETLYRPSFIWGGGRMNDPQFSFRLLDGLARFLSGETVADYDVDSEGNVSYQRRSLIMELDLKEKDPVAFEKWRSELKALSKMRGQSLKRAQFAKLITGACKVLPDLRVVTEDGSLPEKSSSKGLEVLDSFGRSILLEGISLVDWDGQVANPALRLSLHWGSASGGKVKAIVRSSDPRIHFDDPSTTPADGASKTLQLGYLEKREFFVSVWPDRDGHDEQHEIEILYWVDNRPDARTVRIPVKVNDQDRTAESSEASAVVTAMSPWPYLQAPQSRPFLSPPFPYADRGFELKQNAQFMVNLDFSYDRTGFFSGEENGAKERREIFRRAGSDWAYFLASSLGVTRKNADSIVLVEDVADGNSGVDVANQYAFKDFLIYVLGAPGTKEPNARAGKKLKASQSRGTLDAQGVVKSGQVLIEGVESPERFIVDPSGSRWWEIDWDEGKPIDLYSWAVHELGHALFASRVHPVFRKWFERGEIRDGEVERYHGRALKLDEGGHLKDEIDRDSLRGGFGVIDGKMPSRQWLITKLDLLLMGLSGYSLKPHAMWGGPQLRWPTTGSLKTDKHVEIAVAGKGGVPPYCWKIEAGQLPRGLVLNSFDGRIVGKPTQTGEYHFILSLRDSSNSEHEPKLWYQSLLVTE